MNRAENEHQELRIMAPVNRQYKDRLFRVVFREKKDLLDLYNAVNGTDYRDEEELTVTTLEEGLEKGRKQSMAMIEICQEVGLSKEDTAMRIAQKCKMSMEQVQKYMEMYWKED